MKLSKKSMIDYITKQNSAVLMEDLERCSSEHIEEMYDYYREQEKQKVLSVLNDMNDRITSHLQKVKKV